MAGIEELLNKKPLSIVTHSKLQHRWEVSEFHTRLGGLRMPPDIRQGFLDDAENGDFGFRSSRSRRSGTRKCTGDTARGGAITQPLQSGSQAEIIKHRWAQVTACT